MKNINKFFRLLILFFLFTNCKSQNVVISYNDDEPTPRHQLLIKEIKQENEFILFFDSGFLKDKVEIYLDGNQVVNEIISTDNILGSASSYNLSNSSKKIKIILNDNSNIVLKVKQDFPFVNIKKRKDNKLFVEYRKIPRTYQ